LPLGRTKGSYKGELEIVELFGVDASWAKAKKGANFSATDLVYLKPQEAVNPSTVKSESTPAKKPDQPKKK